MTATPNNSLPRELMHRIRLGDAAAADEILRGLHAPLLKLACRMLSRFPGVARAHEAEDVLQGALMRLVRALVESSPLTADDVMALGTVQLRRELIDLARALRHQPLLAATGAENGVLQVADNADPVNELDDYSALHEGIGHLPVIEREVVRRALYDGWTQAKIAQSLQVSVRTVERFWKSAIGKLRRAL